jgi:inhibin beta
MEFSTSKQVSLNQLGWQKVDITTLVQNWYSSNYHNKLNVLVDCSGCIANNIKIHMPTDDNRLKEHSATQTPFLVLNIEPDLIKRTKRRAIDCSQAGKSQCCKQRFYVSFKTLGWDDWIIAPPGYYANYCRGDCGSGIRRTPDTLLTFYSHVFDEVRKYNKLNGNQLCCAPLKFSSMSLIYFGPDGSEIIKRDLPKMVVEECGCP